jgi:hypothetical protein
MNREEWLQGAVAKLRPVFQSHGYEIPELRVSVGWPSSGGLGKKKRTIGQCWFGAMAADGKPQLFISPLLDADVATEGGVLATLVHEVAHVAAGPDAKHGPKFVKVMKKLGLEGKPTATIAGAELIARLKTILEELGPFDHSAIVPVKENKPQTTRMKKCECKACGYVARTVKKWLESVGPPLCPCNKEVMVLEGGDEGEDEGGDE